MKKWAEFAAVAVLGKSSECGICMAPIVTQATRSSFTMESLSIRYLRKSTCVKMKYRKNCKGVR